MLPMLWTHNIGFWGQSSVSSVLDEKKVILDEKDKIPTQFNCLSMYLLK